MSQADTRNLPAVHSVRDLRRAVAAWRQAGQSVALIPTMGALHDGHLALVARGKSLCDRAVASIFVNPTQFGPNEDLARYPRDEVGDRRKLAAARCDLVFMPDVAEMYPEGFSTGIDPGPLAAGLDGKFRPGHFAGVATVVVKLLQQAQPDVACFGEKDYQQLQIIRHVVRDLDLPVRIEGVPILREADGLALSSRNAYLTPDQRWIAPALYRVLQETAMRATQDGDLAEALSRGRAALTEAGFAKLDYLEICDAATLAPLTRLDRPARILVAAWLGTTRLIDNLALEGSRSAGA
jgi:pantoate--beta-alanine ligase